MQMTQQVSFWRKRTVGSHSVAGKQTVGVNPHSLHRAHREERRSRPRPARRTDVLPRSVCVERPFYDGAKRGLDLSLIHI